MQHLTRRQFLQHSTVGSSLVCSVRAEWRDLLAAESQNTAARYDLLIKGGRVIDPSQGLSSERDIAVSGGKIARAGINIVETEARQVLNARGKIVTPGLIDIHVHVYDGGAPLGIPADPNCIAKGVTTVVDAGSVLLNIAVAGQTPYSDDNPYGELLDLRYANPQLAIRTIEQNRDVILGVKVRLEMNLAGEHDLAALRLAKEAADAVRLPLMVHIGNTHSPLKDILNVLTKGDIITHSFHSKEHGILDDRGRVLPEVRAAVGRGVNLDIGHGRGSFSFDVAEKALKQELLPGTISTDLHHYNVNGPAFDMATTLSKFLRLGLTLEQVIERAATNPANTFGFPKGLGTLREGAEADVAVFSLAEGDFEFEDTQKQKRIGHQKLVPVATVKAGRIYGSASIPVVRQ